eukprot:g4329.t1
MISALTSGISSVAESRTESKFMDEQRNMWAIETERYETETKRALRFRRQDVESRAISSAHNFCETKARNIQNVTNVSSLVGGFTMVMFVEVDVPATCPGALRLIHALICISTVLVFGFVILRLSWLLQFISLKSPNLSSKQQAADWWEYHVRDSWRTVFFIMYNIAMPLFLISLISTAIVKHIEYVEDWVWILSSISGVIVISALLLMNCATSREWKALEEEKKSFGCELGPNDVGFNL